MAASSSAAVAIEEIDYEALDGSLAINMIAGAMAGISEHAVMFPVDSIKVDFYPSFLRYLHSRKLNLKSGSIDSNASPVNIAASRLRQHVRRFYSHFFH
jgi:hypothetical protein